MELFEAWCRWCEISFDVWGELVGSMFQPEDPERLHCPNCLRPVKEIQPKESLS